MARIMRTRRENRFIDDPVLRNPQSLPGIHRGALAEVTNQSQFLLPVSTFAPGSLEIPSFSKASKAVPHDLRPDTMPFRHTRSGIRGRLPCGLGLGNGGSICASSPESIKDRRRLRWVQSPRNS